MGVVRAEFYEITPCPLGRLATMPCPRGCDWLQGEVRSLKDAGITDVVSMLMPEEEVELGLNGEYKCCVEAGLHFHRHATRDRGIPKRPAFDAFIDKLVPLLRQQAFIAIHCRAGIGRSTVLAVALLCRLGVSSRDALARIVEARGFQVPDTDAQLEFIQALDRPS